MNDYHERKKFRIKREYLELWGTSQRFGIELEATVPPNVAKSKR